MSAQHRRYGARWLASLRRAAREASPEPWIAYPAIDFLRESVRPGMLVFEYGSGMSTLFWLNSGASCVSVEHNPDWYDRVKFQLRGRGDIDYRLVPPEPVSGTGDSQVSDPSRYISADESSLNHEFRRYVTQIDGFPDGSFDIVLIDGRARPSCIMHSCSKVKLGGILILDNSDREYYMRETKSFLRHFTRTTFYGPTPGSSIFCETSVFVRVA